MSTWIALAVIGGLGAVLRDLVERRAGLAVVNVAGALALGAAAGVEGDARLLLATGFLGAFTSFSGWTARPRREGVVVMAAGLAAAAAARALLGP